MNKNAKMRVGLALPVALLMAANSWGAEVEYIDKDGLEKKQDCTALTTSNANNLSSGCYVVQGEVSLPSNKRLKSSGDIELILADGAELKVDYDGDDAFAVGLGLSMSDLTIYGQKEQTGKTGQGTGRPCAEGHQGYHLPSVRARS